VIRQPEPKLNLLLGFISSARTAADERYVDEFIFFSQHTENRLLAAGYFTL
jgi:hypothetical protein